jgi:hypothetical protein
MLIFATLVVSQIRKFIKKTAVKSELQEILTDKNPYSLGFPPKR